MKKPNNSRPGLAWNLEYGLKMKLSFLTLFMVGLALNANLSYSQKTKMDIHIENGTVRDVIDEIESNSKFKFIFNSKVVNVERKVNISVKQSGIDQILSLLFEGDDVKYEIENRKILLTKQPRRVPVAPSSKDNQQTYEVSGIITDNDGVPLPGVNVVEKGTSNGVSSDFDGNYTINVASLDGTTLVFSYIGFETLEIEVNGQTQINATLVPGQQTLDEVVIIGYGSAKRDDLTGAIGSVGTEALQELTVASPEQALVGRVSGVFARQTSGAPGAGPAINIRGFNSISQSTAPLFVVDGLPTEDIGLLSPNDIERIDVLKDASSAAIYGSRGSNGVIIITTKKGTSGKAQIDFNAYTGLQSATNQVEMMNSREIAQFQFDARRNNTLDRGGEVSGDPTGWLSPVDQVVLDVLDGTNTTDTDWVDEILEEGQLVQNFQLSVRGGGPKSQYYASGEYFTQEGILLGSDFERFSARFNLNSEVSDRFKFSMSLNPSYTTEQFRNGGGRGGNDADAMLGNAQVAQPFYPVRDENGEFQRLFGQPAAVFNTNPVAWGSLLDDQRQRVRILGNMSGEYELFDGFKAKLMVGADIVNFTRDFFRPNNQAFAQGTSFGESETSQSLNWLTEMTLSYAKTFNDVHNLDVVAGYTVQKTDFQDNFLNSDDFPNDFVQTLNAATIIDEGESFKRETSLLSYLARLQYNYDSKYYATATVRRDGSSRFGSDNKWGWFPSFALSWRASQESWLNDVDFLSNLRFRASLGFTGNNNIPDYAFISTVGFENYIVNNQAAAGLVPNNIANPNLGWEQQRELNFAMELSLFNSRISTSIDYFIKTNEDLLLDVQIPSITGFSNQLQNIGEVENRGIDLSLNTVNLDGEFRWTTDINFSTYRNEVKALGPEGADILTQARGEAEFAHITRVGQPVGMFYGFIDEGVITTPEELAEAPVFNPGGGGETRLGDLRFRDISGPDGTPDGIIDENDRTIIGTPHPDFTYGMTNTFNYKGFDLSTTLYGVYGNDILFGQRSLIGNTRGRRNQLAIFNNYFKSVSDPGDGKIPRPNHSPTGNNRGRWSTFHLEDGSFLRISNITLGYSLPKSTTDKLQLRRARIYVTATNPFTFTDYNGFNPDIDDSDRDDALALGEDWNSYPLARTISLGLNVGF